MQLVGGQCWRWLARGQGGWSSAVMGDAAELMPAEAMVLMDTSVNPSQLFKVTIMALMLRRVVRAATEQRHGLFRSRQVTRLHASAAPDQPAHVQSALAVLRSANGGTVAEVVAAARRAYGQNLAAFKQKQVIPAMVQRELVQQRTFRLLWAFPWRRTVLTPGGAAALERLRAALDRGRSVPGFLDRDPRQAAMIAASLGTLILLVPELRPHLKQVARMLQEPDAGVSGDSGSGSDPHGSERHGLDAGDDAGSDAFGGAMDGFDAGFDASFDAGFDAAFDGGGGNGGGDSGGGSGGE